MFSEFLKARLKPRVGILLWKKERARDDDAWYDLQTHTAMYTSYRTHTQTPTNKIGFTSGCHVLWHAYFTLTGTIPFSFVCQDLKLLTTLSQWTPKTKKNYKPRQKLESHVIRVSCFCILPPTNFFFSLCSYKSTNTDATRLRATLSSEFTCFTSTNTDTMESHVVCNPPTKNFGCDRRAKRTGFTLPILLFPDFSREVPPATSKLAKLVKHKWLRIRCVCGLSSSFFLKQARSLFLSLSGVCTLLLPPPPPPPCPVLE